MGKVHFRQRPETKFCKVCLTVSALANTHTQTCRKFEKYQHDIGAIASALQEEGDCKAWGGRVEAEALKKKMENALPTLKYHVDLLKRQRKNVTFAFGFRLLGQRRATDLCFSLSGKSNGGGA